MSSYLPDGRPAPDLLTAEEAAMYLRLDCQDIKNPADTLVRYRKAGVLRGCQIGKRILYPLTELQRFIEEQTERRV